MCGDQVGLRWWGGVKVGLLYWDKVGLNVGLMGF